MGTKQNPGRFDCYDKAEPNEPLFVLLARDPLAADLVRQWADLATGSVARTPAPMTLEEIKTIEKAAEALCCADAMDAWRRARPR